MPGPKKYVVLWWSLFHFVLSFKKKKRRCCCSCCTCELWRALDRWSRDCGWIWIAGLAQASQSHDTHPPDNQITISTGETTLDFQEQVTSLFLDLLELEKHLFSTTSEPPFWICCLFPGGVQAAAMHLHHSLSPFNPLLMNPPWLPDYHKNPPQSPTAAPLMHCSCWHIACIWCQHNSRGISEFHNSVTGKNPSGKWRKMKKSSKKTPPNSLPSCARTSASDWQI